MIESESNLATIEMLKNYSWDYFQLHAKQRTDLFRFYIIFFSLFITAASFLYVRFPYPRIIHEIAAIILASAFSTITIIFHLLDRRNKELIGYSKDALKELESEEFFFKEKLKLITTEDQKRKNGESCKNHTFCFRIIFIVGYCLAFFLIFASVFSIFYYK